MVKCFQEGVTDTIDRQDVIVHRGPPRAGGGGAPPGTVSEVLHGGQEGATWVKLSFSNPDEVWAVKALGNLTEEWQQWYAYVQNLKDHADYDPNTCTEAVKDGWENIRKHEILREKTLVFLRNNFSGYEFLFENWPRHPHEDVTSRLRRKVPTWLHRLEILRASIDYHVSGERTVKERPLLKTPSVSPQQGIQLLQHQIEKAKNFFKDRALIQEGFNPRK
jgi:hypothetical protein